MTRPIAIIVSGYFSPLHIGHLDMIEAAAAEGDMLIARGRVIKPGRRLIIVGAEVFALQNGTEIAIALLQGTMIPAT